MQHEHRMNPDLVPFLKGMLEMLPGGFNAIRDIRERRELIRGLAAEMASAHPKNENVETEDRKIPGPEGSPELLIRIYRPRSAETTLPAMLYIHGGGMVFGDIDIEDPAAEMLCDAIGAVVVSVEYRLAPENPYPAALEDCYATLVWMSSNADDLGIDPARIAVYGGSAGGNLTLATSLLARDRGGPSICYQMALYPMIDDLSATDSCHEFTDVGIWDPRTNVEAWNWYLGDQPADQYAAPIRAEDLSGLPPCFI